MRFSKNKIVIFLMLLFVVIECCVYKFVNQQVELDIYNKVEQDYANIENNINNLMGYKKKITTGTLGEHIPFYSSVDLEWFENNNFLKYPDSTYNQRTRKVFLYRYAGYRELFDNFYWVLNPSDIWRIQQLNKLEGSRLEVRTILPYAWGYIRCSYSEKQYRPCDVDALEMPFKFLTKKTEFSPSFADGDNRIDAILNLHTKYFYIERTKEDKEKYLEEIPAIGFNFITSPLHIVFYSDMYDHYEICSQEHVIKDEIFHGTLRIFLIASVVILLLLGMSYLFVVDNFKKKYDEQ